MKEFNLSDHTDGINFYDRFGNSIDLGMPVYAHETEDNFAFCGWVNQFHHPFVTVEDQDGNCYDIEPYNLEVDDLG